jgi:hypothetical protein
VTRRTASEGGDLGADNLDRVSATAGQILEILNSDAGLMVEFKRMMAEDASAGGQILEEADFSENALGERLREDLRTRALATRLLQRYGYLLPKLNPESEIAQEQKLVLQERAQFLARAAERNDERREGRAAELNAACDPQRQADCEAPQGTMQKARAPGDPRARDGFPMEQRSPHDEYPSERSRPDIANSPREQRTEAGGTNPAGGICVRRAGDSFAPGVDGGDRGGWKDGTALYGGR